MVDKCDNCPLFNFLDEVYYECLGTCEKERLILSDQIPASCPLLTIDDIGATPIKYEQNINFN